MRDMDAELDRQLELERSLARGQSDPNPRGGGGGHQPPTRANLARNNSGSRQKLSLPPPPSEKENRGKIPLLPGRGAPSTSGGASNYAPSSRGGYVPSESGQTTATERARMLPLHPQGMGAPGIAGFARE